jgi:hypothetical protein
VAELPGIPTLAELGRTMEENQVLGILRARVPSGDRS